MQGIGLCRATVAAMVLLVSAANATTIVALGASNTYGRGVARDQAYPAQLQKMLRANGYDVRVVNAGVNGQPTGQMLQRLDRVVTPDTKGLILQPGGNDRRKGVADDRPGNIAEMTRRLAARGTKVIMLENSEFRGLPHQPDGMHLTPEGYRAIAERVLPQVISNLSP